jgi:mono/diheme cytochrome c family protein
VSNSFWSFACLVVCLFVVLGCEKKPEQQAQAQPEKETPPVAMTGEQLYQKNCAKCHASGKSGTPDLAKVGADPAHTPEWIAEHVRNPQTHKPDSKMPSFEGKLKPEEIKSVADYLATKK